MSLLKQGLTTVLSYITFYRLNYAFYRTYFLCIKLWFDFCV